jgi:hypothetical protein
MERDAKTYFYDIRQSCRLIRDFTRDVEFQTYTTPERDYLNKVFNENFNEIRFSASDGNYQLYYPYSKDGKRIVLYFSDYQRYGKLGS